jgi:hypothetical protein
MIFVVNVPIGMAALPAGARLALALVVAFWLPRRAREPGGTPVLVPGPSQAAELAAGAGRIR